MDHEDIWHNDRKWENFYGSAATREFLIFLPTAANLLCYCTSIPSCPSSLPSVVSLLATHGVFFFFRLQSWSALSKVPRLGWSKAVNHAHFWGQHTHSHIKYMHTLAKVWLRVVIFDIQPHLKPLLNGHRCSDSKSKQPERTLSRNRMEEFYNKSTTYKYVWKSESFS